MPYLNFDSRFTNQHPKPPNHIIAQNTWGEAIISIVLFGRLSLEEQKHEAKKTKYYSNKDARKHRVIITALCSNRNVGSQYNNGNGSRSATQRRNATNRRRARRRRQQNDNPHDSEDEFMFDENAEESQDSNHVGLLSLSSREDRVELLNTTATQKHKRRKFGEAPPSLACQSDVPAQRASEIAFLTVGRAIDTVEYLDRMPSDPTRRCLLLELNEVEDTAPSGGRPSANCAAPRKRLRALASSQTDAKKVLSAYRDCFIADSIESINIDSEFIVREKDCTMHSTVVASNNRNRLNRVQPSRRIRNTHSNITPSHMRFRQQHLTPHSV